MEPTGSMMGGGAGLRVAVLLHAVLVIAPVAMVLRHVGFSGRQSLLAVLTPMNLIALWIFIDWPRLPRRAGERT